MVKHFFGAQHESMWNKVVKIGSRSIWNLNCQSPMSKLKKDQTQTTWQLHIQIWASLWRRSILLLSKDKILELWMFHHSPKGINPTGILLLHAFVKPCKDLLGLTILIWKLLWVILPELVIFSMYQTKTFKLAYPLGWSYIFKC